MQIVDQIKSIIQTMVDDELLEGKEIVIFGANTPNSAMINILYRQGYQVAMVIDNSPQLQGTYFLDVEVQSPEAALGDYKENALILIASQFYEEMTQQLRKMGYIENKHIVKVVHIEKKIKKDLSLQVFEEEQEKAVKGFEIYQNIQQQFPNTLVFMSPYKPNGDIYIICSYLKAHLQQLNIKEEQVVIVVIGKAAEHTAKMFNYTNVLMLTETNSTYLSAFAQLMPDLVRMMNPHYWHADSFRYMDGYNNLTFIDVIKLGMLNLDEEAMPVYPKTNSNKLDIDILLDTNNLIERKTVVLAPHVNSLVQIKWSFWEKLADSLKNKGFVVCTNCGNDKEQPIKNTIPLVFSFQDANELVNRLGYLISYRSGFCEVTASSHCEKMVIYPNKKRNQGFMDEMNYFRLTDPIYSGSTITEIVNDYDNVDDLLNHVIASFENILNAEAR